MIVISKNFHCLLSFVDLRSAIPLVTGRITINLIFARANLLELRGDNYYCSICLRYIYLYVLNENENINRAIILHEDKYKFCN